VFAKDLASLFIFDWFSIVITCLAIRVTNLLC
jgi:hypothetical protein